MKHIYCPTCGSLDSKRLAIGGMECLRCKFKGVFREGSMDEINAFRKAMRPAVSSGNSEIMMPKSPSGEPRQVPSNAELREKLKSLKGKKTDDFEII